MKKAVLFKPTVLQLLVIFCVSLLLLLPQLFGRGLILGSDAVFHFNRFYETEPANQRGGTIKYLSFHLWVSAIWTDRQCIVWSIFCVFSRDIGFDQPFLVPVPTLIEWVAIPFGRNVHVHVAAKIKSLRLVVCGGWAFFLLRRIRSKYGGRTRRLFGLGAAILPFCFIPLIDMTRFQRIRPFAVGVSVAALFQIHVFSSILLVLIYIPFFLRTFLKSQDKKRLLLHLTAAIGIFLLLTANIWLAMLDLYQSNQLLPPFVNHHMERNTITGTSSYWWTSPYLFPLVCGLFFAGSLKKWQEISNGLKLMTVVAGIFFLLSSNYLPWQWLSSLENPLIELIQFPFRFFVPATVLILAGLCLLRPYLADSRLNRPIWLILLLVVSVVRSCSKPVPR